MKKEEIEKKRKGKNLYEFPADHFTPPKKKEGIKVDFSPDSVSVEATPLWTAPPN